MRLYRVSFLCGFATGYVLGTRDGRERYDRMAKLARQLADHPAVQEAAGALNAQASRLAKTGAQTAKSKVMAGTSKLVRSRPGRAGRQNAAGHPADAVNGSGTG